MLIRRVKLAVISLVLLTGAAALAQQVVVDEGYPVVRTEEAVVGPSPLYFILAIVVGVILAISFELILTHLSVAAGISSVGPFDRYAKRETKPTKVSEEGEGAVMRTVRKTSNMFGIWALVTATVSLFFASWLAVELSHSPSAFTGFILGLSIWALFYIIMTAIEVTRVDVAGGLADPHGRRGPAVGVQGDHAPSSASPRRIVSWTRPSESPRRCGTSCSATWTRIGFASRSISTCGNCDRPRPRKSRSPAGYAG